MSATECYLRGPTGYCANGRHSGCPYAVGGACEGGIHVPECFLVWPPRGGWKGCNPKPDNLHLGAASYVVISPSHIYMCSCDCHVTPVEPVTVEFDDLQGYGKRRDRIAAVETWRLKAIPDDQYREAR